MAAKYQVWIPVTQMVMFEVIADSAYEAEEAAINRYQTFDDADAHGATSPDYADLVVNQVSGEPDAFAIDEDKAYWAEDAEV